jgi:hypothetical protein
MELLMIFALSMVVLIIIGFTIGGRMAMRETFCTKHLDCPKSGVETLDKKSQPQH